MTSKKKPKKPKTLGDDIAESMATQEKRMLDALPKEAQEKYKKIKTKVTKFSDLVREKFGEYVLSVAIMPPPQKKDEAGKPIAPDPNKMHVLILVDDSDSKRFPRESLQQKFNEVIPKMAEKVDKDIVPEAVLVSLLWQTCFDGKLDLIQGISMSTPIYDTGVLSAIKIAEVHKKMVLQKFERYIMSYVLAGSLIRGQATHTSDIDVFVVIDDTDVKKMTRYELKDRLRAIICQKGAEAGEMLGIRNKLNIQVYILTDFWDSLKEANPIIFTLLRDGVPFFDRGMFMPWKQLLTLGKIKPSNESISIYMSSGKEAIRRAKVKLRDMGMEDLFYALLTPSQAALMLYGIPPSAPKETPKLLREIFVKKEKLLEEKYVAMLEKVIQVRKELEHGSKKSITGKEIDVLMNNAEEYLKRIQKVFEKLDTTKIKDDITQTYDLVMSTSKEALICFGIEAKDDKKLLSLVQEHLVHTNFISHSLYRTLEFVMDAKRSYDAGNLSKEDADKVRKQGQQYVKDVLECTQRKRRKDFSRAKIRVKHGSKFGELILLEKFAFIIDDAQKEKPTIRKAVHKKDGSLGKLEPSSYEELEEVLTTEKIPTNVFVRQPIFSDLQKLFGKDVEIVLRG